MSPFAVIFDMDGVIVDSNPTHKIALRQFCESHDKILTDHQLKTQIYGRTNRDWLNSIFNCALDEKQIQLYSQEKEHLFRKLYKPLIKPVKGLLQFLETLRSENITLAIATSAPRTNVNFTLENTGTTEFFTTIIDESYIINSKPNPEIYLKTAQIINFETAQCLVIEDSLSGVESAKRAGCRVIGLTTTHTRFELSHADRIINNFEELSLSDCQRLFI